ncbi:hypothetical protein J4E85_011102 [Alternaria conjuncta]|uniref:uncharacterized protein n=1 Tax=Alternaria conjuncta TaxID=181017 RepID=UPI00222026BF|nr:uncharacterized protein J4E85_011102 [Alternaria conjuncta]KAI4912168.1 hypothetical protein J4E85_011102 [Alternaria conjuncta]
MANNNSLEKLINGFHGVPLPPRPPPAPTKRISDIAWRVDVVDPFSSEGGWSTEAPDQMRSMKICRRRADLEYLRHGHPDYLDLAVVIGPKSNEKDWLEQMGAMKQEVSIMNGKRADKQSFIAMTLEADISLCNVKMSTHDYHQRGLELGILPLLVKPPTSPPLKCINEDVEFGVDVDGEVTFNHCVKHGKWTKDQNVRMHWVYSFPGRDTVETAGMAHGQIILR